MKERILIGEENSAADRHNQQMRCKHSVLLRERVVIARWKRQGRSSLERFQPENGRWCVMILLRMGKQKVHAHIDFCFGELRLRGRRQHPCQSN